MKQCDSEGMKDDRLKLLRIVKNRIKTNYTWDLRVGMLQLANCYLEYVKTWRANNIFWERVPLHSCQREKGVLVVVLCRVQLIKGPRMAVPG